MSRRSGRKAYTTDRDTTLTDQPPPPPEEELIIDEEEDSIEEDEELLEEDDEVTRCICAHDELQPNYINKDLESLLNKEFQIKIDHGLFIQCDRCGVWQHGYCVGLFENDDVPEKYWCEVCKPELHILITEGPPIKSKRTLYKPVNDRRRKVEQLSTANNTTTNNNNNNTTTANNNNKRKRNSPTASTASTTTSTKSASSAKQNRKERERRHHHHHDYDEEEDDEYKEALQRAIRESAKESGLAVESDNNASKRRSRGNSSNNSTPPTATTVNNDVDDPIKDEDDPIPELKKPKIEIEGATDSDMNDQDTASNIEDEIGIDESKLEPKRGGKTRGGGKSGANNKSKKKKPVLQPSSASSSAASGSTSATTTSMNSNNGKGLPSREELINQPSKPRFVSDRSSIYELRKRTGAILEWLARSQLELEDEKLHKLELFNFQQNESGDEQKIIKDTASLEVTFNENLILMEKLTDKILNWEQNFGKYAP
ncbi:CTI6 [[Candida] subhashii]|uniref:CTI6 n=1 Tax=[Candida] subhashii TaxID=561895 RepID=A0A8J5UJ49_9ASCO|nr:CTI6 [[Candida] subhashii]KAG7660811.1 CTI6 [[Candida] subhashii]